jgi:hypothetical protein
VQHFDEVVEEQDLGGVELQGEVWGCHSAGVWGLRVRRRLASVKDMWTGRILHGWRAVTVPPTVSQMVRLWWCVEYEVSCEVT